MDIFQALQMSSNSGEVIPTTFKFTVKTDAYTVDNKITTLPIKELNVLYPEDFTVNWGDGNTTLVNASSSPIMNPISHTYSNVGTYQVSLISQTGKIPLLSWYNLPNNSDAQLKSIDTPFPAMYEHDSTLATYAAFICHNCINLYSMPNELFKYNPQLMFFMNAFSDCPSLTSIPQDLFWYNLGTMAFSECFKGDYGLTILPSDMFKNINAPNHYVSLDSLFEGCYGLINIPRLWNNCSFGGEFNLSKLFFNDSNIISVSADLFYNCNGLEYCTNLNHMLFGCEKLTNIDFSISQFTNITSVIFMCYNNLKLVSVPLDFFRYNTKIYNFSSCFYGCLELAIIPNFLLKYQTSLSINYTNMFYGCLKLMNISNLFCDESTEISTRFSSSEEIDFNYMFYRNSFGGVQGTCPKLWDYTYGYTPSLANTERCFGGDGNSLTSLTNYSDIPNLWKS